MTACIVALSRPPPPCLLGAIVRVVALVIGIPIRNCSHYLAEEIPSRERPYVRLPSSPWKCTVM